MITDKEFQVFKNTIKTKVLKGEDISLDLFKIWNDARNPINAPPKESPTVVYKVQFGDTLSDIALRFYGDVSKVERICEVNGIWDKNYIDDGQILVMPDLENDLLDELISINAITGAGNSYSRCICMNSGRSNEYYVKAAFNKGAYWVSQKISDKLKVMTVKEGLSPVSVKDLMKRIESGEEIQISTQTSNKKTVTDSELIDWVENINSINFHIFKGDLGNFRVKTDESFLLGKTLREVLAKAYLNECKY